MREPPRVPDLLCLGRELSQAKSRDSTLLVWHCVRMRARVFPPCPTFKLGRGGRAGSFVTRRVSTASLEGSKTENGCVLRSQSALGPVDTYSLELAQ